MNRAALLPLPGDPFLFHYWIQLYDRYWHKEVNTLYVFLNSPVEKEVVEYIAWECSQRENVRYIYSPSQLEHGEVINRGLDHITEKYLMLIEDDGFIFKEGIVSHMFGQIESGAYDIVGSKRPSCAPEILKRAKEVWGVEYEGEGDQGCNFWPCFFFSEADLLRKTDRHFGSTAWKKGDIIKELNNYVVQGDVIAGDTMVSTSLQLRAMVPKERILCVNQYHAHPDDLDYFYQKKVIFDGNAPWTHIGSLSSGVSGVIRDDQNRALARRKVDEPKGQTKLEPWCNTPFERREWERRVQVWLTAWEHRPDMIKEFAELYKIGIDRIIKQYSLSLDAIRKRQEIYKTIGL